MFERMTKLMMTTLCAASLTAGMAQADDDCFVPMTEWQPREAVAKLAAEQGWTVRRIKIDDGCYEVIGNDAEGRAIEVKVNPGTLAIEEIEFEEEHDEDEEDRSKASD